MTAGGPPLFDLDRVAAIARFDSAAEAVAARLRGRPWLDRLGYAASEAGNFAAIWHVWAWAEALVLRRPGAVRRAVMTSSALVAEAVLVNGVVKSRFRRRRPQSDERRPHRLRTPRSSSFPSGHASAAMVAAALATPASRPFVRVVGLLVALSRVHVRIHHASDVVGGLAIGALLGAVARRVLRR
ncbi:MAG: phosphatase PAP2 family protein [Acidimicrobiia bacterium]|nr:phosphatase PAP2 family protein [Acidimicrobiia bacterium]